MKDLYCLKHGQKNWFLSTSINLDVQENAFIEGWSFLRNFCGAFAYKNYLPEFLY